MKLNNLVHQLVNINCIFNNISIMYGKIRGSKWPEASYYNSNIKIELARVVVSVARTATGKICLSVQGLVVW